MEPLEGFHGQKEAPYFDPQNSSHVQSQREKVFFIAQSWAIRSSSSPAGDWVEGLKSKKIKKTWLKEANQRVVLEEGRDLDPGSRFSPKTWQGFLEELRHCASLVDGVIQPGPIGGVTWVADGLVGQELSARLMAGAEALEDLARKEDNWHPGTRGRVLNLIDPSLYSLIPGQSRICKTPFTPAARVLDLAHFSSTSDEVDVASEFQWIPSDVELDSDGKAHFTSYVNNLNPWEHGEMYAILEEIISSTFVPLWEKLLTAMRLEKRKKAEEDEKKVDDDLPPSGPVVLGGRMIQVIVRMATTHLTPGNSSHPGGDWHMEGMPYERIVAVGLHYYSNHNITQSKLGLGEKLRTPVVRRRRAAVRFVTHDRNLAEIETSQGRSIVFSNELIHRVLPFQLENPELPGHRKILAFFLVDPGDRIISTTHVPCQQKS